MVDTPEDPAVTGNSISVNYIKADARLVLVTTVTTDAGVIVDSMTVTDPGMRLTFMTMVKPVVWNTWEQFDNWYQRYRNLNQT